MNLSPELANASYPALVAHLMACWGGADASMLHNGRENLDSSLGAQKSDQVLTSESESATAAGNGADAVEEMGSISVQLSKSERKDMSVDASAGMMDLQELTRVMHTALQGFDFSSCLADRSDVYSAYTIKVDAWLRPLIGMLAFSRVKAGVDAFKFTTYLRLYTYFHTQVVIICRMHPEETRARVMKMRAH
jgi:hypothetical protein